METRFLISERLPVKRRLPLGSTLIMKKEEMGRTDQRKNYNSNKDQRSKIKTAKTMSTTTNIDENNQQPQRRRRRLPKRIILVRHGESQGNLDTTAYSTMPANKIPLTPRGVQQARDAGRTIRHILTGHHDHTANPWGIYFYVSPYVRARSTLREIGRSFPRTRILGAREECRIREQDFGNFEVHERMLVVKEARERFGRFFFRFPEGESAADVLDRIANFLESLWRDIDMKRLCQDDTTETNLVIVSHGVTSRIFLMKWFKWTVEQFELLNNPGNCEIRVMQLGPSGEYSLLIHHTEEELQQWGLSPEMIADQRCRATSSNNDFDDYVTHSFFDNLPDNSDSDDADYSDAP